MAFESIDGPPPQIFQTLVRKLNAEAEARKVPVVSHAHSAPYRIRGYVALGVYRKEKRTAVSWVWDVYDQQQRRAVRFSGEEKAGPAGPDPWAAVDDEVLTRIARAGMERLALYFQPATAAPVAVPPPDAHLAAAVPGTGDDFHPEAHGIFRLFRPGPVVDTTRTEDAAAAANSVPLPRHRPAGAGDRHSDRVAFYDPAR